jgi:hypothetical protein
LSILSAEQGGRSKRRGAADKSPEKKPEPSPKKRRSRGKVEEATEENEGEQMEVESKPAVEESPEKTKTSQKRKSRGKVEVTTTEEAEGEKMEAEETQPEEEKSPLPKRRSRGKVGETKEQTKAELKSPVEKSSEKTKTLPKRRSRGKAEEITAEAESESKPSPKRRSRGKVEEATEEPKTEQMEAEPTIEEAEPSPEGTSEETGAEKETEPTVEAIPEKIEPSLKEPSVEPEVEQKEVDLQPTVDNNEVEKLADKQREPAAETDTKASPEESIKEEASKAAAAESDVKESPEESIEGEGSEEPAADTDVKESPEESIEEEDSEEEASEAEELLEKEQTVEETEPEKVGAPATAEPEPVEMETCKPSVSAPELPSTTAASVDREPEPSPTRKRKRGDDEDNLGSPPKKRKPSAEDEEPTSEAQSEEAMETEPEDPSVVDSSSAVKLVGSPVVDGAEAVKEAEAIPVPEEPPVPKQVQSNADMTEPPTSSHEVISKFPAETEQLTPEAEPAEVESLPTPPEQDVIPEEPVSKPVPVTEPDQSDECAPTAPAPMPETREAEHVHETKESTPVVSSEPVVAPEPVQSSQEVIQRPVQPAARSLESEPDQSSAVQPVQQAMETDLSSSSAEACSIPQVEQEAPEVVEPEIIPEHAQMLEDSTAAPSSSSSQAPLQSESQGSEAVPVEPSQGEEAMEVEQPSSVTPVSSTVEADSGANTCSGQQSGETGYVVVNMADVPPSDSAEVQKSLPREHLAPEAEQGKSSDNVQVSSSHADVSEAGDQDPPAIAETANPPLLNNHEDTHSNAVDAINGHSGSTSSKDLLLNRKYIQNVAIDSNTLDSARQFSVASYNILAECHLRKNDYSHATEEVLEQGYRHDRLMQELQYLDADVFCLQEVDPDYYTDTLEPALRGYVCHYMGIADTAQLLLKRSNPKVPWRIKRDIL